MFPSFLRVFFEVFSIVGVNAFVLISGWFGVRFSIKSFANILFQCLFCSVIAIIWYFFYHHRMPDFHLLAQIFMNNNNYWFVFAYIGLLIFSPVLNNFVISSSKSEMARFLVVYFTFEFIGDWLLFGKARFYGGYSLISFIGLYLFARYCRFHIDVFQWSVCRYSSAYCLVMILSVLLIVITTYFGNQAITSIVTERILAYNSPISMIGAMLLTASFIVWKADTSRIINSLAASSFAIYLIHFNPLVYQDYIDWMKHLFLDYNGVACLSFMALGISMVGIVCILVDKVRIFLWGWMITKIKSLQ